MNLINVTLPNAGNMGKNIALGTITPLVMASGKPLEVLIKDGKASVSSLLGVPALSAISIKYNNGEYVLNDCVIAVSQEKQIVTTYLQGRNGSIKEYIADGDFNLDIQATIGNDYLLNSNGVYDATPGDYPMTEMRLFMELLKAPQALEVSSAWLDLFGIKSIVITGYSINQETHSNRQKITISALSDEPYEIKLLNDA